MMRSSALGRGISISNVGSGGVPLYALGSAAAHGSSPRDLSNVDSGPSGGMLSRSALLPF